MILSSLLLMAAQPINLSDPHATCRRLKIHPSRCSAPPPEAFDPDPFGLGTAPDASPEARREEARRAAKAEVRKFLVEEGSGALIKSLSAVLDEASYLRLKVNPNDEISIKIRNLRDLSVCRLRIEGESPLQTDAFWTVDWREVDFFSVVETSVHLHREGEGASVEMADAYLEGLKAEEAFAVGVIFETLREACLESVR